MTDEERFAKRKRLQEEGRHVNWFSSDVSFEEFERHFNEFLSTYTPEELVQELIECGAEFRDSDELTLDEALEEIDKMMFKMVPSDFGEERSYLTTQEIKALKRIKQYFDEEY